jgi:hypothetical protein
VAELKSPIGLFPNILGFRISYLSLLVISKQSVDKDSKSGQKVAESLCLQKLFPTITHSIIGRFA